MTSSVYHRTIIIYSADVEEIKGKWNFLAITPKETKMRRVRQRKEYKENCYLCLGRRELKTDRLFMLLFYRKKRHENFRLFYCQIPIFLKNFSDTEKDGIICDWSWNYMELLFNNCAERTSESHKKVFRTIFKQVQ